LPKLDRLPYQANPKADSQELRTALGPGLIASWCAPAATLRRVGIFDPDLNPAAWFDESLVSEGWFDSALIPLPALGPVLAMFLAVTPSPDYAHPMHHHDDLIAVGGETFLALSVVVVALLKRLRK